jgi:methylglutaconyl-CoA hydratase
MPAFQLDIDDCGVARLTLDRAEKHNAFDDELIAELIQVLEHIAQDDAVRVLVLGANGKSFSAGADLGWMRRMADYDEAQNLADAMQLAELMRLLNELPKPTIARVQGAAYGGGVGLVACCDIALASEAAMFSLSEVRLGLIPGVISPYVLKAIGERAVRRYMLSAERFDARQACQLGLVHEVVTVTELDARVEDLINILLDCGPAAQTAAKDLILALSGRSIDQSVIAESARRIASIRASVEGREGLNAFLEKRKPSWVKAK